MYCKPAACRPEQVFYVCIVSISSKYSMHVSSARCMQTRASILCMHTQVCDVCMHTYQDKYCLHAYIPEQVVYACKRSHVRGRRGEGGEREPGLPHRLAQSCSRCSGLWWAVCGSRRRRRRRRSSSGSSKRSSSSSSSTQTCLVLRADARVLDCNSELLLRLLPPPPPPLPLPPPPLP